MCVCEHRVPGQMTGIVSSGVTTCRALTRAFLLGHSAFWLSASDIPAVDSIEPGPSSPRLLLVPSVCPGKVR